MKKAITFLLLILFFCNPVFAEKKKTQTTPSVIDRLKKIETFSADFTQETSIKSFSKDVYTGKLYMVANKAALWDYKSPYRQYYLFNENGMEFYDSSTNQLVIQNKNSSKEANVILSVLFNLKSLEKNFTVSLNGKSQIQLKPNVNIGLKYIILSVNKNNDITGIYSEDEAGNITEITFSNIKINKPIDKSIFSVSHPKDAEVFQY
ncbi:MAG: outer membrane lipoprotein carrier protein LolA [Calditerrivibrio sp.]|nr:outer membrane lipoprotein carrier protein LolA [Calditerrivibrio sp.]